MRSLNSAAHVRKVGSVMSIEQIGGVVQTMPPVEGMVARQSSTERQGVAGNSPGARSLPVSGELAVPGTKSAAEEAKQLAEAVKTTNRFMQAMNPNLQFSIDKDTEKLVVKLIESGSKEVIRQIPSEEMLAIAKALDKLQGLLIREKA